MASTFEQRQLRRLDDAVWRKGITAMPNPTPEMLDDPRFEVIFQTIKDWDVNVPEYYGGYCGANGSHAAMIFNALFASE